MHGREAEANRTGADSLLVEANTGGGGCFEAVAAAGAVEVGERDQGTLCPPPAEPKAVCEHRRTPGTCQAGQQSVL